MDFLRIRQKARDRARERDRPALETSIPAAEVTPAELGRIEDALRAELGSAPGDRASGGRAREEIAPPAPVDPLDEFFWHEDELAPTLPDLIAATALPHDAEPPEVRREWITFRLGEEEYGIEIEHVREILKAPPLTEIPRGPAHVLGVIMVRGDVIAVFDPRARLGLPPGAPGRKARVLVCDTGAGPRGVLVDSVSHVVRLAPSAIEPRPPSIGGPAADYIAGIGRERHRRLFILLDAAALLADPAPAAVREVLP